MDKALQKEIEIIMEVLECPKDFGCYKAGYKKLCRAKDIGLQSFLQCLEGTSPDCKFSLPYGGIYFCRCPIRRRIIKNLKE
ncbi:MAG: hypothetical protein ABSA46_20045 [Thermodesulfovibrionales bacterium]|jgi:hypothetical protein